MTRRKSICYVLASISIMLLIACNASSQTVPSSKKDSCNNAVNEEAGVLLHPCEKDNTILIPNRPDNVEPVDENKVYDVVEEMPSFPDGDKAMHEYLRKNIQYSDEMAENDVYGRVIVSFVVEKDGSLTDFNVVRSLHPTYDKEALRVAKSMPKWTPGSQNGVKVRVKYIVPVDFRLE